MEVLEATAPDTVSIEMRKFRLLDFIINLEDEAILDDLEDFIYGYGETASDEELEMLNSRFTALDANPESGIPLEVFMEQMREKQ